MTANTMTRRLSIFPLTGAVLFPGMQLPLHIFEPRYRALVQMGEVEQAAQVMEVIDADPRLATDPCIAPARSALELAGTRVDDGELAALHAASEAAPDNMDAQLAYAEAAFAAGQRDAAADTLLTMIAADREWNDGAARAKLLKIFEATGLEDEWVVGVRRRLSRVLFG